MKELLLSNPKFSEMDNESVAAINTFIGVNIPLNKERSVMNMCKAWEDQKEEGREEGRQEAEETKLIEYVENLSDSLQISAEEACEKLKESYEKYLEAKKKHI